MKKPMLHKGKETRKEELAEGKALASGRMTPAQYADQEMREGYADGGMVAGDGLHRQYPGFEAPNASCHTQGPGVRSLQDYKK